MGRADYLDLGNWNARCSMCGAKFKASELTKNWQGMYRCSRCQEGRQPQDFVRAVPDVQTPPWTQNLGAATYAITDPIITENSDTTFGPLIYITDETGNPLETET